MTRTPRSSPESGYSLMEILVVVALISLFATLSISNLSGALKRAKLLSAAQDTAAIVRLARLEAIKRSVPTVVEIDFDARLIRAWTDIVDDTGAPVSNLMYDPDPTAPSGTVDYLIKQFYLEGNVEFWGATDANPEEVEAVVGLTDLPDNDVNGVVFNPDGSARAIGAIRFADGRGANFLEVFLAPVLTGRAQIRKYNPALPVNPEDGSFYFNQGPHPTTGEQAWEWEP
ncbi:MAG TPA: GspH/FimT family pseudopilin [Thermoanaerobaculia bacterium]|nr:GspH/FimT family pseudopilin [Thermoanaerobaculia bacterium]